LCITTWLQFRNPLTSAQKQFKTAIPVNNTQKPLPVSYIIQLPVANPVLSSDANDYVKRKSVPAWDLTVPYVTPVYPVKAGKVIYAGCNDTGGYGCWVMTDHGDGWESVYDHLIRGSIQVSKGQYVTSDTILGRVGWTGKTSFGPHVHLEIRYQGRQVDPERIFGSPEELDLPYKKFCSITNR
jgi:murein DD-endopeptidase MepM/ murein hydrolase activator NlpD